MQRGMRYVGVGMRADKIVQFMWEAGLTEVPVLDDARRPVGMVSLGELIASGQTSGTDDSGRLALLEPRPPCRAGEAARVEDIMSFGVATIHENLPLGSAAALMLRAACECLVVVDDQGIAVGALAMPDIMRWLVEQTADDERHRAQELTPGLDHWA
jgi:CBS domain-containing protein